MTRRFVPSMVRLTIYTTLCIPGGTSNSVIYGPLDQSFSFPDLQNSRNQVHELASVVASALRALSQWLLVAIFRQRPLEVWVLAHSSQYRHRYFTVGHELEVHRSEQVLSDRTREKSPVVISWWL